MSSVQNILDKKFGRTIEGIVVGTDGNFIQVSVGPHTCLISEDVYMRWLTDFIQDPELLGDKPIDKILYALGINEY